LATSSNAKRVMTPSKMTFSSQAKDYACELIGDELIGSQDPWRWEGETADMARGSFTEMEASKWYQLERDVDVECVGLCIHDTERWACSPDRLVGFAGGLEIKCPARKTHIRWLVDGGIPAEHLPQVHHCLIVTGREWWDWMSYHVGLPALLVRVVPDDYTRTYEKHLKRFNELRDLLYAQVMKHRAGTIDSAIARKGDQLDDANRALVPPANQYGINDLDPFGPDGQLF
jgi:hypothetical protein